MTCLRRECSNPPFPSLDELAQQSLSPAHLTHLNIYLSSQAHFAVLNQVYKSFFGVDPPSRACIAINLTKHSSCHLVIDAVAFDDGVRYSDNGALPLIAPRPKKVLHVQGRSYWAAANIRTVLTISQCWWKDYNCRSDWSLANYTTASIVNSIAGYSCSATREESVQGNVGRES
jgi:hypothetical protein